MENKTEKVINDYEELIVLLRQLHNDTPILEKQHKSIKDAFGKAQDKLDSTVAVSEKELEKNKKKALVDFENECGDIISRLLSDAQSKVQSLLSRLYDEETKLEQLIDKIESKKEEYTKLELRTPDNSIGAFINNSQLLSNTAKAKKNDNTPFVKMGLEDKREYTGGELKAQFKNHIGKDLIVKRFRGNHYWNNDYCLFVTKIDNNKVCGDTYKDGVLDRAGAEYPIDDMFMIYMGKSNKIIISSR